MSISDLPDTEGGLVLARYVLLALLSFAGPVMFETGPGEMVAVTCDMRTGAPAVLLVPGLSGCTYGYRELLAALGEQGVSTIAVEPLGLGRSERPRGADYTLTAQAKRLATVCDSLSVRQAIVISHGAATGIALRLALLRPDLVSGIVSLEGGAVESAATPTVRNSLKIAKLVTSLGGDAVIRDRFVNDLKESSGDASWVDRGTVRQYLRGPGYDMQATLDVFLGMATQVEPMAVVPELGRIAVPVRVLRGTAEHKGALDATEIAVLTSGLPDVRIIDVPEAGHFLQEERPDVVLEAVRALLSSNGGP